MHLGFIIEAYNLPIDVKEKRMSLYGTTGQHSTENWSLIQILLCRLFGTKPLQWWLIVSWKPGDKMRWNRTQMQQFPYKGINFEMTSAKCRPFCLGLNMLKHSAWHTLTFYVLPVEDMFVQVVRHISQFLIKYHELVSFIGWRIYFFIMNIAYI